MTQTRLLTMTGPLGSDALPVGLRGSETISAPFSFIVSVISPQRTIKPDDVLFQPACVTLEFAQPTDLPARYFHGMIRSFAATGGVGLDRWGYEIELVPSFWFLNQTVDCRIWQKMSAIDVIKTIFSDAGISAVEWNISGTPPVRETVTQFNETDFDFVTRLLEEEGCFYFFKYSSSGHTMVVADSNSAFQDVPQAQAMHSEKGAGASRIDNWRRTDATAHGSFATLDYDPEQPRTLVQGDDKTILKASGTSSRDVFTWPALTTKVDVAKARQRYRAQAADAFASLFDGAGTHPLFSAGGKFTMPGDAIGTYALRSVSHSAVDETQWRSGAGDYSYSNSFSAFPAATTWRQPQSVAKPRMTGTHTAVVIGPQGQEIYSDKLGRVQIQFFWDHRKDAKPQDDICWVRVIQPWSGSEGASDWGWHHLPRIGTEVAVSFMDGDPDRPVVIGTFYNGVSLPVFDMSSRDNWTKSGFRSRSSTTAAKGGGSNYSEFSFDDKTGSELVFLHAEKDMLTEVEHDQTLKVDNCRFVTVKADETIDIGKSETITIGSGRSVTIKDKDDALTITTGNLSVTTSAGKMTIASNSDYALESKIGNISVKADVGAITIEALQSITLKCGPTSLTIDPTGITLKGMMMSIKGDVSTTVEGLMTTVKGDAMLTVKGGIIMLN